MEGVGVERGGGEVDGQLVKETGDGGAEGGRRGGGGEDEERDDRETLSYRKDLTKSATLKIPHEKY